MHAGVFVLGRVGFHLVAAELVVWAHEAIVRVRIKATNLNFMVAISMWMFGETLIAFR